MRHEITTAEATAIRKARAAASTTCGHCGRTVKRNATTLDHYCDEQRALDIAERKAGTR